jgi:hypothetical protein
MGELIEIDFRSTKTQEGSKISIMGIESTKTARYSGNIGTSSC